MSGQSWTPAPKWGIVPLHPLPFGTILGRSFSALRHNPKVLFGFAVLMQLVVLTATTIVISFTLIAAFMRLESVSPSSPDFEAIFAGTMAWAIIASFLVGIGASAFTALVQGVVAADMGFATVGTKARLREVWRRMRPALWRLLGFAGLTALFGFVLIGTLFAIAFAFAGGILGGNGARAALGMLVAMLLGLAAVPLAIWLGVKLLLVPAVLVLERVRFREALVRSWRLTRGRFWFAFGVIAVISLIMGVAAQVVSVPASLVSFIFGGIVAPTGDPGAIDVVGLILVMLLPQLLVVIVQAVGVVVQCTAGVLVYIDCRMRYEGLDQTLLSYIEQRDHGVSEPLLGDPFAVDAQRAVPAGRRPMAPAYAVPPGYGVVPPGYAPQPGYAPAPGYAPPPSGYAPPYPGYAAPGMYPPPHPETAPAEAPEPPAPDSAQGWAAPGSEKR